MDDSGRMSASAGDHGSAAVGEAGSASGRRWVDLSVMLSAQIATALLARHLLWPAARWSVVVRTFAFWDLVVIAGFGVLAAASIAACGGHRRWRSATIAVAWTVTLVHSLLLAGNPWAVYWLGGPLDAQWMYLADFGRSETPRLIISTVADARLVGMLVAAAVLPLLLLLLVASRRPLWVLLSRPVAPLVLAGACLVPPLSTGLAVPRQDNWRDAVSNPLLALLWSRFSDPVAWLATVPSDHHFADYRLWSPAPAIRSVQAGQRPDFLVVVLESVGARALSARPGDYPTLARLAAEGTVLSHASVAVAGSTRSLFSLFYSRYPLLSYRAETREVAPADLPRPLTGVLRRHGYRTAFLMSGDLAFQDAGRLLSETGAGPVGDVATLPCDRRIAVGARQWTHVDYLPDRCTFDAARGLFERLHAPRMAIVWTGSTHFPYGDEGQAGLAPTARYRMAIRTVDTLLGATLARLARQGIKPIVLVVGDHGEAFGEHGFKLHGQTIFDEEIAIPFILSGPGIPAGVRDPRPAQMVDVAPTLLDLAGIARPAGWQGLSVLGRRRRARSFAFSASRRPLAGYREGDIKYVLDLSSRRSVAYDLSVDPMERHPRRLAGRDATAVEQAVSGWMAYNRALYGK